MRLSDVTIYLKDLEISMFLGIHEHEKSEQQRVLVFVEITVAEDRLGQREFYDYDQVRDFIIGFTGQRVDTQENFIREIISFVMEDEAVKSARVTSKKPDIFPDAEFVGASISAERD